MAIVDVFYVVLIICMISFVFIFAKFFGNILIHARVCTGFVLDKKVDMIIHKSVILGDLYAKTECKIPENMVNFAMEKATAIATDVMLQNGINPRDYHIPGLVLLNRLVLGLGLTNIGGEHNGKSQRAVIQH